MTFQPELPRSPSTARADHGVIGYQTQPDYNVTQDQYGLLQGTITIVYDATSPSGVRMPPVGSAHPTDTRLLAYKSSASFSRNGKAMVTTDYIGLKTDPTLPEWDVSSGTAETSILFHPRIGEFAVLKKGTGNNPIDSVTWKSWVECEPNTNKFKQFNLNAPGDLAGISKYLIPRASIKFSFYTKRVDTVHKLITNLSTWATTPVNGPKNIIPPTEANFLLQSCGVTPFGDVFKVSCEWQMSEHGKPWNPYIYPAFGSQPGGSGGFKDTRKPTPL